MRWWVKAHVAAVDSTVEALGRRGLRKAGELIVLQQETTFGGVQRGVRCRGSQTSEGSKTSEVFG